MMMGMHFQT